MVEDLEVLKNLAIVKGRIDYSQYLEVLKRVANRMKIGYLNKKNEKDMKLKEYVKRRWKVGGKRLKEYVGVLKKVMGKKVTVLEESLGEL